MTSNDLVTVSTTRMPARRRTRYATYAFASFESQTTNDRGAVWIIDSKGNLILPADQRQRRDSND